MNWQNELDFERAIKEIICDETRGHDFCLDPLRFEDLSKKYVKENIINKIRKDFQTNKYSAHKLLEIDVPKSNFTLRPAARPTIFDWIVYTALINFIGDTIYNKIPYNSFSFNRFRDKHKKTKKRSIEYWVEFDNETYKLSQDNTYQYLLTTDITAFFEHISIEELSKRLKILSTDESYIKAVNYLTDNILSRWTENNKIPHFGLPQGPTASTVLADIYLYPVDKSLNKNRKLKFIRYMDDFRLFAKSEIDCRIGISLIVKELRKLKLNLNAKKTTNYLLSEKESLKTVFDPKRKYLDCISKAFNSNNKRKIQSCIPELMKLKDSKDDIFKERHLRFFIGKIIDLMKSGIIEKKEIDELIRTYLLQFEAKPHLSNTFCWLFVVAGNYSEFAKQYIIEHLCKFIGSKNNIYQWQEMWALDTIRQLAKLNKGKIGKLESKYSKNNSLCYSQFALIVGKSGNHDKKEDILKLHRIKNDEYRATMLALQDLDKRIVKKIRQGIPEYYCLYIDNLKTNKYGFEYNLKTKALEDKEYY